MAHNVPIEERNKSGNIISIHPIHDVDASENSPTKNDRLIVMIENLASEQKLSKNKIEDVLKTLAERIDKIDSTLKKLNLQK